MSWKHWRRGLGRIVAWAAAIAATVVLVAQLTGEVTVDSTSLALMLVALLLIYAAVAPSSARELLDRINLLKLPGGIEVQMQATARAERVLTRMPEAADAVTVRPRKRGGGAGAEYDRVRAKLEERLQKSGRYFGLGVKAPVGKVVKKIESKDLLSEDELHLIRDLLGDLEDEVGRMPVKVREEYLDSGWKFAKRFRTLVFERLLRKELARNNWVLIDFDQSRHHRPDFFAFKGDVALLIAARVVPESTLPTRERLHKLQPPFGATAIVVVPDTEKGIKKREDEFPPILQMSQVLTGPQLD